MRSTSAILLTTALCASAARIHAEAERPNILWLTCEDISPYLGCYGFEQAETPHLDALALEGIRFTHAYANAPVCAVARSALLTGMHSSTLGTHQMRSNVLLPAGIPAYPKLFRDAGYYWTNNSKKDYNSNYSRDSSLWDESSRKAHWKNRPEGKPFFAVFNTTVTHEGQLSARSQAKYLKRSQIPKEPRIHPSKIKLPPYHPDQPAIRQDWARLHDMITLMDSIIGSRLRELAEAGLAENTIVFFYSDHGGQLSRSKRYIYNVGTQVPFIVRFPKKWQHLAPGKPGSTNDELVQFVDCPKTVLSLAGIQVPEIMQGRILFGPRREDAPATAHFYRDRMAERYDFSRAVTDGRYYFVRNFMPHRPRGRDSSYGYQVQANWGAWRSWYEKSPGTAGPIRSQFFRPKPVVQLFDTQKDPWHVHNLADDPALQGKRKQLAEDLDQWMIQTRDIGLIPEPLFHDLAGPAQSSKTLYEYAQSDAFPVEAALKAAKAASAGEPAGLGSFIKMMGDEHPVIRHWGAYGCFRTRSRTEEVKRALNNMIESDPFAANRIMAAQALGLCGDPETAFSAIMKEAKEARHGYVLLFALNAFQYSHTDDRLTRQDWSLFSKKAPAKRVGTDNTGFGYAKRIISASRAKWPERQKVD